MTQSEPLQQGSISEEIGCNVELITVDNSERRRNGVSNKEISDQEIQKRCTRSVELW